MDRGIEITKKNPKQNKMCLWSTDAPVGNKVNTFEVLHFDPASSSWARDLNEVWATL